MNKGQIGYGQCLCGAKNYSCGCPLTIKKPIMKDISKCSNKDCPLKKTCIRWTAKAEENQCYANFECNNGTCDGYWDDDEITYKENK
jgi:hypothetical protein